MLLAAEHEHERLGNEIKEREWERVLSLVAVIVITWVQYSGTPTWRCEQDWAFTNSIQ